MNPIHKIVAALASVREMPERRAAMRNHERIRRASSSEPVLGFGGVLDSGELVHGGAVKLLALRDAFRCAADDFNLLYLVSSAQPRFSEDLVRVCRARGIKFVWNQNGVGYPAWAGAEMERHNAPMRRVRAQADFVIYQSVFCRESAQEFLGPCETPSEILLNPVDLEHFCPAPAAPDRGPLRLLSMGTQNYRERVVSAMECVRDLRAEGLECTLTVAGPLIWRDAERDARRTAAELGVEAWVKFMPPFRQDAAPDICRAHHLLLHPKYMDPCPTVVAEALACGLPVVASRSGGVPEMVDDDCAVLIDVPFSWQKLHTPSGRELADAAKVIATNPEHYSRSARRRAEEKFDVRDWIKRHDTIFRSLLAGD